jgi:hypothetical protein
MSVDEDCSLFGSTFSRLVSLTVVFGASLNFDFSAKSGLDESIGAGVAVPLAAFS